MSTTTAKPKVFTNEAWREQEAEIVGKPVPLKTVTATRVKGSGPLRYGDMYKVELDGEFVGHVRVHGRNAWSIHYADGRVGNLTHPWSGTLDRVVWTLVPSA